MTKNDVIGLFDTWNQALQSQDPKQVAALYAEDAVLLPTISNQVRSNAQQIADYFGDFVKLAPQGKLDQSHVRIFDNLAMHSGVYTFSFGDGSTAQARFSFVYIQRDGNWQILEHHSSRMPEAA